MNSDLSAPPGRVIDELLAPVDERVFAERAWAAVQSEKRGPPDALIDFVLKRWECGVGEPEMQMFDLLATRGEQNFVGWWEIDTLLMRVEEFFPEDVLTSRQRAAVFAALLLDPMRPHSFQAEFHTPSPGHEFTILDLALGGASKLHVGSSSEGVVTALRGEIQSATLEGALYRIRQVIDEFLGAMIAAQLCELSNPWLTPHTTVASVHVDDHGWRTEKGQLFALDPRYTDRLHGARFVIPPSLSDPEKHVLASGDFERALNRQLRFLRKVLAGSSQRATEIRNACRLGMEAVTSSEFGVTATLAFCCLEGLLLAPTSRDEVLGRLLEAVAHALGRDFDDRASIRKRVKTLYDARSSFVHTGLAAEGSRSRSEALSLMWQAIWREGNDLSDPAHTPTV